MIINNLLRIFSGYLSAWYPNNEISTKKDVELREYILNEINKKKFINKNFSFFARKREICEFSGVTFDCDKLFMK